MSGEKTEPGSLVDGYARTFAASAQGGPALKANDGGRLDAVYAVALGAHDGKTGKAPRSRPALLAEVARLCGEGTEAGEGGYDAGIIDGQVEGTNSVLDALQSWVDGFCRPENIDHATASVIYKWINDRRTTPAARRCDHDAASFGRLDGARSVLGAIERWHLDPSDLRGVDVVLADLRRQVTS